MTKTDALCSHLTLHIRINVNDELGASRIPRRCKQPMKDSKKKTNKKVCDENSPLFIAISFYGYSSYVIYID